jgi:hypothetical protein
VKPAYVEEAARLLKKSLIHVETERIVLSDVPAKKSSTTLPYPPILSNPSVGPLLGIARTNLGAPRVAAVDIETSMDVDNAEPTATTSSKGSTSTVSKPPAKKKGKQGRKAAAEAGKSEEKEGEEPLVVSYEDYKKISNMLVAYMRDYESSEEEDSSGTCCSINASPSHANICETKTQD